MINKSLFLFLSISFFILIFPPPHPFWPFSWFDLILYFSYKKKKSRVRSNCRVGRVTPKKQFLFRPNGQMNWHIIFIFIIILILRKGLLKYTIFSVNITSICKQRNEKCKTLVSSITGCETLFTTIYKMRP